MESLVDELCTRAVSTAGSSGTTTRLTEGRMTTTGHVLGEGVGLRQCLEAVKERFRTGR